MECRARLSGWDLRRAGRDSAQTFVHPMSPISRLLFEVGVPPPLDRIGSGSRDRWDGMGRSRAALHVDACLGLPGRHRGACLPSETKAPTAVCRCWLAQLPAELGHGHGAWHVREYQHHGRRRGHPVAPHTYRRASPSEISMSPTSRPSTRRVPHDRPKLHSLVPCAPGRHEH